MHLTNLVFPNPGSAIPWRCNCHQWLTGATDNHKADGVGDLVSFISSCSFPWTGFLISSMSVPDVALELCPLLPLFNCSGVCHLWCLGAVILLISWSLIFSSLCGFSFSFSTNTMWMIPRPISPVAARISPEQ